MFSLSQSPFSFRRFLAAVILALTVVAAPAAVLLTPRPAQAQFSDIAHIAVTTGKWIWERIEENATLIYERGAAVAFRNMARTFTQKIAYDAANMLASGGKGQTPLFSWKNLGKSVSDARDAAMGSFLDGIASGGEWGKLNICEPAGPGAPYAKLMITLPIFEERKPAPPRCTLSKLKENWGKVLNDPEMKKDFLKNFSVVFDPKQSDLGVGVEVQTNILKEVSKKESEEKEKVTSWGGILPITQTITDFIKTPAPRVERAANMTTEQAIEEKLVFTGDILADALGIFTNTLAAKLMKRLMQGDIPNPAGIGPSSLFGSAFGSSGVEYAQAINATLLTVPLVGGGAMDIISEFSACPADTLYAAINNCTIDAKFEQALHRAEDGNALTVGEAVSKGLLNGAWVFKEEKPRNVGQPNAWYLSDIKKLRLARILPLGWELAAQKVSGQDISLKEVLAGFANPASPYYHLIDPNWVLKAPSAQCRLIGPGQVLQPEGARRYDTCVDVQNCVAENDDGTCSAWGYCTREKNIWRFGGDSCEFPGGSGTSPYASCQTFTARGGERLSYLQNSLANFNDGVCSGAAGCKWYSTQFNSSLLANTANRYLLNNYCSNNPSKSCQQDSDCTSGAVAGQCLNPRVYLKGLDKITCDAKSEGCSQFLRLNNINVSLLGSVAGVNPFEKVVNKVVNSTDDNYNQYATVRTATLRAAPAHLNCYDTDPKNDAPECKNYLAMCQPADVGCELYTPQDGAPAVPGVFGPLNTCSAQCVGYQAYRQQPSFFEKNPAPVQYFIPSTARKCSAEAVGCEEFTNIDKNEQLEYYSSLRYCVKPGSGEAAYFTWVGSELTGYQLKKYSLKAASSGAPATTDSSGDCRSGSPLQFPTADPDCKEFYDVTGTAHYRNLSVTITASADCTRYRATNVSAADCTSTGGTVGASGKCFYQAIPNEGKKCTAPQVGCREFKGPTGDNVKLVFPLSTFGDSDARTSWPIDATPASGWKSGTPSNDASVAFGRSFDSGTDKVIYKDVADDGIKEKEQYIVSFWAKKSTLSAGITESQIKTIAVNEPGNSNSPVESWWQNIKKQWSEVPSVKAQSGPLSLSAVPAPPFNNDSFANSQNIILNWSINVSATDEVRYKLSRVSPSSSDIIPLTTRLADKRCKDTAGGNKDNNPCSSNDLCKDNTNTCTPSDYKCTGTVRSGESCTSGDDGYCKNLAGTCNKEKKCVGLPNKTCASDNDCRDANALCQATTKKCSGGINNYRKGEECVNNDYCREPGICYDYPPAPRSGTVTVSLPQGSFTDKGLLPVSAIYQLEGEYRSPTTTGYVAVAPFQLSYNVNNPPGDFNIIAPAGGATNQPLTPTIKWSVSERANSYIVNVAGKEYNVSPSATPQFTVPADVLQHSQSYTVTVKAKNNHPTIIPEKSVTFTTIAASAGVFSITWPDDEPATLGDDRKSINITEEPPFIVKWSPSANAIGYVVAIYQEGAIKYVRNFAANRYSTPDTGEDRIPPDALSYDKSCQITVIAQSAGGATKTAQLGPGEGATPPCHTMRPPSMSVLQDPVGPGSDNPATPVKIKTVNPIFRWRGADFARKYDVEIQENTSTGYRALCSKLDITVTALTTPEIGCTFRDLGSYRWRINARSLHPNSTVTAWHYFTVDLFASAYGAGGVGYAQLPGIIGSKKDIPVPPAPQGLKAEIIAGSPGRYEPEKCTDPNNPPSLTGKQDYKVNLSWDSYNNPAGDNKALGFTLYRGLSGRAVQYLGCFGSSDVCAGKKLGEINAVTYQDADTNPEFSKKDGNRVVYQLRAFNAGGESKGISAVISTPNPPVKPDCRPDSPPPATTGKIVIKMTVDNQPAEGNIDYTINNSAASNIIPAAGLVIDNQAPGDYKFSVLSGSPTVAGVEISSLEASPGGGVSCVGFPCREAQGILSAGQILTITINYVTPPPESAVSPKANIDFVLSNNLTDDWQLYTIGPVELPTPSDTSQGVRVRISAAGRFVIDNIALQRVTDTIYVNKNSWVMPKDNNGNALCQTKDIGCKAYKDRQNTTYNLTGFSKICRLEAVGCEALVDTRNSDSPRASSLTLAGQTITTSQDSVVYRVYDPSKACPAAQQACQRVGEPQLASSGQVQSWGDKFVRLDPDIYNTPASPLCSAQQDKCEEYKVDNVTHYFKNPGNNICEYKQLAPAEPYGWYKQGTSEPCNLLSNPSFENFATVLSPGTADNIPDSGKVDDNIEDGFIGWNRNGGPLGGTSRSKLYAVSSFGQGYYLGDTVLKVVSANQAYSGVWSDLIELPTVEDKPRYFTVSARLYVPLGANMSSNWELSQHAMPSRPVGSDCPKRGSIISCKHYDYEPGSDILLTSSDKGKWVYKQATIKVDPGVRFVSVGIIIETSQNSTPPAGQEIYIDGVSLTEGASPYAYTCPAEMSSCQAYREPNLTQKTYYYLNNDKLDRSSCRGQVSEKDGCLLINDLSRSGELTWSSALTYERSRRQDNMSVAPEPGVGRCSNNLAKQCAKSSDCGLSNAYCDYTLGNGSQPPDANLILKVRRDRVCAEWLSCQTSTTVTDPQTGKSREICYSLGRCNEISGSGSANQCANWLEPEFQQHPLDEADYVGRDITWAGQEYSGYSIPGLCSLDMVSSSPACGFSLARAKACRIYPESDAPFPAAVARFDSEVSDAKIITRSPGYKDANVCQPGEDCECTYQRAVYKNGEVRFYGFKSAPDDPINKVPAGITCPSTDPDEQEKCSEQSRLKQITLAQGLRGYCLEKDSSRRINAGRDEACLSWLPIDAVQGETSIFDDKPEAGFVPARTDRNLLYCLTARGNASLARGGDRPYYLEKVSNAGRKVKTISSWSDNPWANNEGLRLCETDGCPRVSGNNAVGTYSATSQTTFISGTVDHNFKFSIGLGDTEKSLGGIDAIDSVQITVDGPSMLGGLVSGFDTGQPDPIVLSRIHSSAERSIKGRLDYFRVWADFTNPDDFLTFNITDDSAGSAYFFVRISYQLREWCSVLGQVVDKEQDFVTNKAWTNRVNPKSTWQISALGYKYKTDTSGYPITSPFGAVLDSPLKNDEQKERIVYVHQTDNEKLSFGCVGENDCNDSAGAAYSCAPSSGFTCGQWMCLDSDLDDNFSNKACTPTAAGKDKYCGVTPACSKVEGCGDKYKADQPYMCTGTNPAIAIPGSSGAAITPQQVVGGMQEIFAKLYKTYSWQGRCSGGDQALCQKDSDCANGQCRFAYYIDETTPYSYDISSNAQKGQPPVLRAVVRDNKGKTQGEAPDSGHYFSLSTLGKNFIFANNSTEYIIGTSPVTVTALFYAYNSSGNQMPLRFVGVDWGDQLRTDKNIQIAASLKNHKPVCAAEKVCQAETSKTCSSNEQCGQSGPCGLNSAYNFGDSPEACIDDESDRAGYFFYANVYTCKGSTDLNWDQGVGACVFTPRVAVRDNWGWWSNSQYNDNDKLLAGKSYCSNDTSKECTISNAVSQCGSANNCLRWQNYSSESAGGGKGVKVIVRPKTK